MITEIFEKVKQVVEGGGGRGRGGGKKKRKRKKKKRGFLTFAGRIQKNLTVGAKVKFMLQNLAALSPLNHTVHNFSDARIVCNKKLHLIEW